VSLQLTVENAVRGFGLELVELERCAGGLLRVVIDRPWQSPAPLPAPITVDDCEQVTRQLQYALEAGQVEYRRLEVSSPGIDRLLRDARDFERFLGEVVEIALAEPIGGQAAAGQVAANRKHFRGQLQRGQAAPWRIVWSDPAAAGKPGQRVSKRRAQPETHALEFDLGELKQARLAPVVDFKGKGRHEQSRQATDTGLIGS
jgi:ribosome maturation factor RimP